MKKTQVLVSVLLLVLLLAACAPKVAPAPAPAAQPPAISSAVAPVTAAKAPAAPVKAAWEIEWERTVQAAKAEGAVVLYAQVGEYRRSLAIALKEHGIALEMVSAPPVQLREKIGAERRAGLYSGDIYTGGTGSFYDLKAAGFLVPLEPELILPDVKDLKMWYDNRLLWVDDEHFYLTTLTDVKEPITINTNLVRPGEISSYRDLLNPKWTEKIIMLDPSVTGGGGLWFGSVLTGGQVDEDFMRKLATQKPVITRDVRLQMEWLVQGKKALAIAAQSAMLTTFKGLGAPLKGVRPVEGTYMSGSSSTIGLMSKAAHPNAAKFFVNWYLTKEGQTLVSKAIGVQSARLDVPTDFLDADSLRKPGEKYFNTSTDKVQESVRNYYKVGKEIFGIK